MIKINNVNIGKNHKPFIIAEMSGNHNNSLDRALKIVEAVAYSGAQALKLQTYTADSLTLNICNNEFNILDDASPWSGKSLYELYQEASTPWEWHHPIIKRAKDLGLICFSTPFDENSVEFLEQLEIPAYKIASFENNHLPLIKKIGETNKPVFLSTGLSSLSELNETVQTIREAGCNQLILMKCTSTYPASAENSNLLTIPNMRDLFNCEVGLSDHTMGIGVPLAAIACGATVIEKHFTLSRLDKGVDSSFSMEPEEMKQLVDESIRAWNSLGKVAYGATEDEKKSLVFRRSIYIAENIRRGEVLNEKNMRIIRPGFGLMPRYYHMLLGRKVNRDLKKGTAFQWEFI